MWLFILLASWPLLASFLGVCWLLLHRLFATATIAGTFPELLEAAAPFTCSNGICGRDIRAGEKYWRVVLPDGTAGVHGVCVADGMKESYLCPQCEKKRRSRFSSTELTIADILVGCLWGCLLGAILCPFVKSEMTNHTSGAEYRDPAADMARGMAMVNAGILSGNSATLAEGVEEAISASIVSSHQLQSSLNAFGVFVNRIVFGANVGAITGMLAYWVIGRERLLAGIAVVLIGIATLIFVGV